MERPTTAAEHEKRREVPSKLLEALVMQRTWIWQPYHHADNTVADRQPLRPDPGERADDDVAQSLARKMMAWRETREQARSPQ